MKEKGTNTMFGTSSKPHISTRARVLPEVLHDTFEGPKNCNNASSPSPPAVRDQQEREER